MGTAFREQGLHQHPCSPAPACCPSSQTSQCTSAIFWIPIPIQNLVPIPATLSPSWPFSPPPLRREDFTRRQVPSSWVCPQRELSGGMEGTASSPAVPWEANSCIKSRDFCVFLHDDMLPVSGTFWISPQLAEPLRRCRLWACLSSQVARAHCLLAPGELVSKGQAQHHCSAGLHCLYSRLQFQVLLVARLPSACTGDLLY